MEPNERDLLLHEAHVAAGAMITRERGWHVPNHYGDIGAEERALAQGVGLLDRSDLAVVDVLGDDRVAFLQGLITNDVRSLSEGRGCLAALLDVKARVQMLMAVLALDDRLRLLLPPGGAETLVGKLEPFIIMEDVELVDRTGQLVALSLQGPRTSAVLASATGRPIEELDDAFRTARVVRHVRVDAGGLAVDVVCADECGRGGAQLWVESKDGAALWRMLMAAGEELDLIAVGRLAAHVRRIESGIPAFGIDVDETTFLPDLPLDALVSWTKGCYLGQEPIARARYRGRSTRTLSVFVLPARAELPSERVELAFEGRDVGWITSSARSVRHDRMVAMGYLRREYAEPGTLLTARVGDTQYPVQVVALPTESATSLETT